MTQVNSSEESDLSAEIAAYLEAHLKTGQFMGSVLVARAGQILLRQGYGMANLEHNVPHTPSTKFRLASVSKQFTAAAILQLQERGLLQVHQSIAPYVPNYANGDQITIHHLLTHTAGIPNYTSFPDYAEKKRTRMSLDDLIAWFSDKPLEFTPGDRHCYSNSGYTLLTKIIETASGQSYSDYMQRNIFTPLEMTNSGYNRAEVVLPDRAAGYLFTGESYQNADFIDMSVSSGAGGLYSTIEDLYCWDQALYSDAILGESSKRAMFDPIVALNPDDSIAFYGYGWIRDTHYERDRLSHGGGIDGFSTAIVRYPQERLTLIVLSNLETAPIGSIIRDLAAIVFRQPYELPKMRQAIEVDPAIYTAYVGEYELTPEFSLSISTEGDRIFVQATGQPRFQMFPESETKFFLKVVDAQLSVVVDETGKAQQVILHQNGLNQTAVRKS